MSHNHQAGLSARAALELLDAARDGIFVFDPQSLRFSYVNQAAVAQLGYTRAQLLGMTLLDIKPQFDEARLRHMIQPLIDGQLAAHSFVTVHRHQDGVDVPVEVVLQASRNGGNVQLVAIARDISERQRAKDALPESAERYRAIFETVPVSLWIEDWSEVIAAVRRLRPTGVNDFPAYFAAHPEFVHQALRQVKILDVNPATLTLFKAESKEEILASLEKVFSTPDTMEGFVGELAALGLGQAVYHTEMSLRTLANDLIHVLLTMTFPPADSASGIVWVSLMDITGRKQAEEALIRLTQELDRRVAERTCQLQQVNDSLRQSEERYRTLVEQATDGITVSRQGRFVDVNPAICQMVGYSRPELLTMGIADLIIPEEVARLEAELPLLAQGKPITSEWQGRRQDGSLFFAEVHTRPLPEGLVLAFVRDVSARKKAEESLRESERRLHAIIDNLNLGILLADLKGKVFYWNQTALRLHGFTSADRWHLHLPEFRDYFELATLAGQKVPLEKWPLALVLRGQRLNNYELHVRRLDKKWARIFSFSGSIVTDVTGQQVALLTIQDVTERQQAEAERLKQLQIINLANDAIIIWNPDNNAITYWNDGAERLYGWRRKEALGQVIHTLLQTQFPQPQEQIKAEFLRTGSWEGELLHTTRAGPKITVLSRWTLQRNEAGQPSEFLEINTDVTQRRRAEDVLRNLNADLEERVARRTRELETLNRSLESARRAAEQANLAKSEFLSRMSHELRTPLNGILGFAQRLTTSSLDGRDQERVGHILKAGQHLLEIINEILDISRIESGHLNISPEPIQVHNALEEAINLIRPLAREQHIALEVMPVPPDWYVRADNQRLKQVLLNLLANAVKYNRPQGRVSVAVALADNDCLQLAISDTGAGIAPEKMGQLFEPFNRLGAEQSGVEGTGLGLALSKKLVELMAGRISVKSEVGQGSTFTIELQRAQRKQRKSAEVRQAAKIELAQQQRTLLYVEDNLDNVSLVEDILADRPHLRLLPAQQGRLGLDLARQHHPDLILLDLHLPDMSGDELLRRLQADPQFAHTPVVILSADATPGQIERLRAMGIDHYLTKPLDVASFLAVVDQLLSR